MKGLILKDLYMTVKYCRAFLFISVLFIAVSLFGDDNIFFIVYPVIFAGIIPVTLISYDEREKWSSYSGALPYSRTQLVSVKYIMGLIFNSVAFAAVLAVQTARALISGSFAPSGFMILLTVLFAMGITAPALMLPFIFKFGAEKGRIAYFVIIGVLSASAALLPGMGLSIADNAGLALISAAVCIGSAALYALSWVLSVKFYKKREL